LANNFLYSRIGTIVKKKIGNSPKRNYERRIIKEFFRYFKFDISNNSYDIIFILKQKDGSFLEKKEDFKNIITRIQKNDNK